MGHTNNKAHKMSIECALDTLTLIFFPHKRHLLPLLNSVHSMIFCTLSRMSNDNEY